MTVGRDDAIKTLCDALPQLQAERERLDGEWRPDLPPFTVLMGAMGEVLAETVGSIDDESVEHIAGIVESLLLAGSEDVKNGVTTGFLESVIGSSDTRPGAERFFARLGPESRRYCRDWDAFTGRKTPGVWL